MNAPALALTRAIEALKAVSIEPYRDEYLGATMPRYAYKRDGRWGIIRQGSLMMLGTGTFKGHADLEPFTVWMPAWWSPERRFAIRLYPEGTLRLSLDGSTVATFVSMAQAHAATIYGDKDRVVTAGLETGAEVPA